MNDQPPLFESPEGEHEPKVTWYKLSDGNRISSQHLPQAKHDVQLDAMRTWFYQNYEDPVECCPYESAEGGYQYIYGGPYDANEELSSKFGGEVDDDVIEELSNELDDVSAEWSGNSHSFDPDLDEYLFQSSAESLGQKDAFSQSALNIERLLEAKVEPADRQTMLRLLYVNVITALETYLSDKFISSVKSDEKVLRKFVETTPEFEKQNLPLSKVFSARESIEEKVREHLLEVVWHRLDKVQPMFGDTLGIKFPPDVKELHRAIIVRHDCVHRNGKTKDGKEHVLDESKVKELLTEAGKLVAWIEAGSAEQIDEPIEL